MSTPAPPLAIVNHGPNDPNAPVDNFPPSFPGGRALPPETLAQLTPTEVDQDSWHAQVGEVASNWTINERGERYEWLRIIETEEGEWVCLFWYPSPTTCLVRCINSGNAFREVWYKGAWGAQGMALELQLVIPSGRGDFQRVELHQEGWVLDPEYSPKYTRLLVGGRNNDLSPAVVQTSGGITTAVMTNGSVVVKYRDYRDAAKTLTCIRRTGGGMKVVNQADETLVVQEARGQNGGTLTWWHRVPWADKEYEEKRLMRNGKWKRDFAEKPPPPPPPVTPFPKLAKIGPDEQAVLADRQLNYDLARRDEMAAEAAEGLYGGGSPDDEAPCGGLDMDGEADFHAPNS
jgi:hypothetical protein